MVTPGDASTASRRVDVPNENDVLCGRGGSINSHLGNEKFRTFVEKRKRVYLTARFKREKRLIASSIVTEIRNMDPPGRFLAKTGGKNGYWYDIGDEKARDKTSQALRENAPTIRAEIETEINQQREEMKRREDDDEDSVPDSPSPTHMPPPHPSYYPPSYGWDYYYNYYGYAHPPPPPHHPHHLGPPPPHAPPTPPAVASYPGHHPDAHQWAGAPPSGPPPYAASRPNRGHDEFKEGEDNRHSKGVHRDTQEDEDFRLAMELQHQEKEAAFEDKKRRYQEDPNRNRMSISYVTPGTARRPNSSYARDRGAHENQSKVAKASSGEYDPYHKASAAFAAMKVDDPRPSPAELTQEQRDHRLAVELQEQEDYEINSRREATFQKTRRAMSSNAYSKVQRTGGFMSYGKSDANAYTFGTTSNFENLVPASFAAWTKASVSFGGLSAASGSQDAKAADQKPAALHKRQREASDSSHDHRRVQFKDGTNGSRQGMRADNYSPINFQEDDPFMMVDDGISKIKPDSQQGDDNNSSLLAQVANHILNPWGSWDTSKHNSVDDGAHRNHAPGQTRQQSVTSGHNPPQFEAQRDSPIIDGHEVQLRDVLDELSMPPPEPRAEIDWPSRVGSCHTWIPESLEAGAASFFGNSSRMGNLSTFQLGISPVNSMEMDASAAGTEQYSCAGSVGGGSLCQVFDKDTQAVDMLPSPMNHRIIHQIPSWERSMRSRSPLSLGSVEDSDDSMIRVRHEKFYDKNTGPSAPPMSTIEDMSPPPAVRPQARGRSQNSDMDWEESNHHPE
jgi:hypothetical protein